MVTDKHIYVNRVENYMGMWLGRERTGQLRGEGITLPVVFQ